MSKYWELSGSVRTAVLELLESRKAKLRQAKEYVLSLGADNMATAESGLGVMIAALFKAAPSSKAWKPYGNARDVYLPRRSCTIGRETANRLEELGRAVPTGDDIGKVIGLPLFNGNSWQTPGVVTRGKRVFVSTPDRYEPPKKLRGLIKRVSDLAYEKIAKAS